MFARLRKLQFFKAVESCTGGYGRFRCQRVKKKSQTIIVKILLVRTLTKTEQGLGSLKNMLYI